MKKKMALLLVLIMIISLGSAVFAYSISNAPFNTQYSGYISHYRNELFNLNVQTRYQQDPNGDKIILKDQAKEVRDGMKKIDRMLNDAWNDIVQTHKLEIDYNEYLNLTMSWTRIEFINNHKDKEFIISLIHLFEQLYKTVPSGSTQPFILLSKDYNEIIFAFKQPDGHNSLAKAILADGEWNFTTDETQGKPKLNLE